MSPKLEKTKLVRLETDLNELLAQEAKARRVSVAFLIREALRERYKLVPARSDSQEAA